MFQGLFDLFGSDDENQPQAVNQAATQTPGMTKQALGFGLMSAAQAIANANRPSPWGSPGLGSLIGSGAGGFGQGVGMHSLLEQKRAVNAAKTKMAEFEMQKKAAEQAEAEQLKQARQMYLQGLTPEQRVLAEAAGDKYFNEAVSQSFPRYQHAQVTDAYGNTSPVVFNPQTGKFGGAAYSQGGTQGTGGYAAPSAPSPFGQPAAGIPPTPSPEFAPAPPSSEAPPQNGIQRGVTYTIGDDGGLVQTQAPPGAKWQNPVDERLPDGTLARVQYDTLGRHFRVIGEPVKREGLSPEAKETQDMYSGIMFEDIGRAKDLAKKFGNTGIIGGWASSIPGTGAHDLSSLLETISAGVGFDRLQAMRNSSPTGGALGQVSEKENALLQAALGSLKQSQSQEQLSYNLNRIEDIYADIVHGKGNWIKDPVSGQVFVEKGISTRNRQGTGQQGPDYESMSDEDLLRGL